MSNPLLPEEKKEEFEEACRDMNGEFMWKESEVTGGKEFECAVEDPVSEIRRSIGIVEHPKHDLIALRIFGEGSKASTVVPEDKVDGIEIELEHRGRPYLEELEIGAEDVKWSSLSLERR